MTRVETPPEPLPLAGFGVRPFGEDVWLPGVAEDEQHWVLSSNKVGDGVCGKMAIPHGMARTDWRRWPKCKLCRQWLRAREGRNG